MQETGKQINQINLILYLFYLDYIEPEATDLVALLNIDTDNKSMNNTNVYKLIKRKDKTQLSLSLSLSLS
jgi:hypothetical protein